MMVKLKKVWFVCGIAFMLTFHIVGCDDGGVPPAGSGGGDSGGGGGGAPTVCCDISCNQSAPTAVIHGIDPDTGNLSWENAADVSYYDQGGDVAYTITWYCATYENCTGNCYVQLTYWDWDGDGLGWILETEYIGTPICESACL